MKVKLTIFIPTMSGGGAERVVARFVNNIDLEKYQVTLLLLKNEIKYELNNNVKIVVLNCNYLKSALPKVISYLRKYPPDIMISHMSLTNILSIIARFLSKKKFPLIIIEHSTPSIKYKKDKLSRKFIPLLMRFTYKLADEIICVSKEASLDLMKLLDYRTNKIRYIYNPIVDNEINLLMNKTINHRWLTEKQESQLKVIIGIGRLEPVKNFTLLISSFSEVYKNDTSVRLIILGEGSQKAELVQLVNTLNLNEVVDFPGFVENPYAFLNKADLFVLSSDLEGLPTVLVEALACGVPIVSTNCPHGPKEILENGKFGELVPVNNPVKLKEAILVQLSKSINKNFLRERAMLFSVEKSVTQYIELIDSYKLEN